MPSDKKKKDDKAKLKDILNAVCAILNSSKEGGKLIVFSESLPYSPKDADDITRKIEQKLETTFGLEATREIINKISRTNHKEMHYQINQTKLFIPPALYTVNYNLYSTTYTQVHNIPSGQPLHDIVSVIKGEQTRVKKNVLCKHLKEFVHGEMVNLEESKETQLKLVEDKTTDKCADRMTTDSNKLTCYVSAFANGSGGHIYYGIKLNKSGFYVAYGQTVQNKNTIINKVESTIGEMFVWRAGKIERLIKGKHWDIFFEKVSNMEENLEKYVIVISVNSHVRGVFAKEPESYVMDADGMVTRMKFSDWTQRFLLANCRNIFSHELSPQTIGRSEWSSPKALKKHLTVLEKLVILRNDGCVKEFNAYKDELFKSSDANSKCLLQQQEAANFFRKGLLDKAVAKLNENEDLLNEIPVKCSDVDIYQTRRLYWKGVVKRAQGCYDECRKLCEEALQRMDRQPTILVLPWAHYNRAKILEIDLAKETDTCKERRLKATCMRYYESALRSSFALEDFPENLVVDLKQRVLIAMARLCMGACYDGERVVHKTCSPCDIKHADYLMGAVDYSVDGEGLSMTKLSEAEYLLLRAERYYHSWKERSKPVFIKKARETSVKALDCAKTSNFKDVRVFAEAQIVYLIKE